VLYVHEYSGNTSNACYAIGTIYSLIALLLCVQTSNVPARRLTLVHLLSMLNLSLCVITAHHSSYPSNTLQGAQVYKL
jgi:hypothetical protein